MIIHTFPIIFSISFLTWYQSTDLDIPNIRAPIVVFLIPPWTQSPRGVLNLKPNPNQSVKPLPSSIIQYQEYVISIFKFLTKLKGDIFKMFVFSFTTSQVIQSTDLGVIIQ